MCKRIGRYLKGKPRAVQRLEWQDDVTKLDTYVDSDWAGCKVTCRSTSGGASMLGSRCVMAWSATQAVMALSSGEAELNSMVKGVTMITGLMSLAGDFG